MAFGDFLSGAAGGAMSTAATANPFIIGGSALLGGVLGLFDSPESQQEARMNELRDVYSKMRTDTLNQGFTLLGKNTVRNMASARQAAARRAAAMGRMGDIGAFTLPAERQAQEVGGKNIEGFLESTNRAYDEAMFNAEMGFAGRPVQPSAGEYLLGIGKGVSSYLQGQDYIKALRGLSPGSLTSTGLTPLNLTQTNPSDSFSFTPNQPSGFGGFRSRPSYSLQENY